MIEEHQEKVRAQEERVAMARANLRASAGRVMRAVWSAEVRKEEAELERIRSEDPIYRNFR